MEYTRQQRFTAAGGVYLYDLSSLDRGGTTVG
jgi:hypothetical protein